MNLSSSSDFERAATACPSARLLVPPSFRVTSSLTLSHSSLQIRAAFFERGTFALKFVPPDVVEKIGPLNRAEQNDDV
jgi:hypothetical protein